MESYQLFWFFLIWICPCDMMYNKCTLFTINGCFSDSCQSYNFDVDSVLLQNDISLCFSFDNILILTIMHADFFFFNNKNMITIAKVLREPQPSFKGILQYSILMKSKLFSIQRISLKSAFHSVLTLMTMFLLLMPNLTVNRSTWRHLLINFQLSK